MDGIKNWSGQWSDGQTANAHHVEIELQEDNLVFRRLDQPGTVPQLWPYDDIRSPNPTHSHDSTVLLSCLTDPKQRLFIDEPHFAKHILARVPTITAGSHQWSLLKWPLGIAVCVLLFWGLTYLNIISPANSLAQILPDTTRVTLGKGVVNTIVRDKKVCNTAQGTAAFDKLLSRLYNATPQSMNFDIKVVDFDFVNAFAAPGDQIIVSGELIRQADSADEVAGVIAHEMGHSIERHPESGIIRALGLLTVMQIFTAGESSTFGEIAFYLVQSGYSRAAEQEADDHAGVILNKTSIDTRPLAGFFKRLLNKKSVKKKDDKTNTEGEGSPQPTATAPDRSEGKDIFSWISSHPATIKRMEAFNRSTKVTSPPILNDAEWRALKLICGEKNKSKKPKKPS